MMNTLLYRHLCGWMAQEGNPLPTFWKKGADATVNQDEELDEVDYIFENGEKVLTLSICLSQDPIEALFYYNRYLKGFGSARVSEPFGMVQTLLQLDSLLDWLKSP